MAVAAVSTESLRHASGAIWSGIRSHRIEDADDVVHLFGAEQCLGSAGSEVGVGRFVEAGWFYDTVGGELVDDEVDEVDLVGT